MNASEFMSCRNWVVCGNVTDENKFAHKIYNALKLHNFQVAAYHPLTENDGEDNIYNRLSSVPFQIQVLDLCINPKRGIEVVKEAEKAGIKRILVQPGAESEEIKKFCEDHGMEYVEGCALVELAKL